MLGDVPQFGVPDEEKGNAGKSAVVYSYPLVRYTDMDDTMKKDVMEVCTLACERHTANNEMCAKMIKEVLDKKFGPSWHVVVGEGFGFEISYETKKLLYMFFAGSLAVCVWKCSY